MIGLRARPDTFHGPLAGRQTLCGSQVGVLQVDDDAIRVLDRENLVARRRGEIDNEPGTFRTGPQADIGNAGRCRESAGKGAKQADERQEGSGSLGRAG